MAARIFAAFKAVGENIELVTEFAKLRVYENRPIRGWDYISTFAAQHRAEQRFLEGGTHIVTDSPMLLQCYYARRHDCPVASPLFEITSRWETEYPSCNIVIPMFGEYQPKGRWQGKAEAQRIDQSMRALLDSEGEVYHVYGEPRLCDFNSLITFIRNYG